MSLKSEALERIKKRHRQNDAALLIARDKQQEANTNATANNVPLDAKQIKVKPKTINPRSKTNKTGFKGVYQIAGSEQYRAVVKSKGKQYHLGTFTTPEEASEAWVSATKELRTKHIFIGE